MPRSPHRRVSRAIQEQRRRLAAFRFASLATALMLSIAIVMLAAPLAEHRLPLQIAVYVPLLVGAYVVSDDTRLLVIWTAGLVLAGALGLIAFVRNDIGLLIADVGFRSILLGALMFWITREMVREVRVSLDTILGGICLYLLIGYLYSFFYVMLLLADPGSLAVGGQPWDLALTSDHPLKAVSGIFYFSFTAFTTMGFGDITAVTPLARFVTITEGMLGQLYPAIFIARLVSLNLVQASGPPSDR